MSGRIIGLSLLASSLAAGSWYMDLNSKRRDLQDKRDVLSSLHSDFDRESLELTETERKLETIQKEFADATARTNARQALVEQVPTLETERDTVVGQFEDEVRKVRVEYSTMVIPEVLLQDGRSLKNVTVSGIANGMVALTHSGSMESIPSNALPADLRERLRIGMTPMMDRDGSVADAALADASVAAEAKAPVLTPAMSAKVASLEANLRDLTTREAELRRNKQLYLDQVKDYRLQDERSMLLGRKMEYKDVSPKIVTTINGVDEERSCISAKMVGLQIEV